MLAVTDLGSLDYRDALQRQHALAEERRAGRGVDTLLLVEHPPVFTLGRRRGAGGNVLAPGDTPVIEVERGGDVTWHGPGQLVGYPILALDEGERDVHAVLRRIEAAVIELLAGCRLEGVRREGFTGVWCRGKKVASLGVAVRGWVTSHGFALNVDCDLSWFERINPCGLEASVMGSVASLGGVIPPREALVALAGQAVARAFDRTVVA